VTLITMATWQANIKAPFDIYFNDFDGNNKNDIILSYYNDGEKYPVRGKERTLEQIPRLEEKSKKNKLYAQATLNEMYDQNKLDNGLHYQVNSFASVYIENKNGKFTMHQLPKEAQVAPINQIVAKDFDQDGNTDIVVAGNLYASEVETPRADSGYGLFLRGDGSGRWHVTSALESGIYTTGDVKDLAMITIKNKQYIMAAKNKGALQFVKYNAPDK